MSADLVWQIIGRGNSFTVKDRASGHIFSTVSFRIGHFILFLDFMDQQDAFLLDEASYD
jgi:hypothetical protein